MCLDPLAIGFDLVTHISRVIDRYLVLSRKQKLPFGNRKIIWHRDLRFVVIKEQKEQTKEVDLRAYAF